MVKSLTSITQLSRADIEHYIDAATALSGDPSTGGVPGRPIASLLFFEESTRTRVGFEAAMYRLGGQTIVVDETKYHKRMSEAESLSDTVRSIQSYCDIVCLRHPNKRVFEELKPFITKPIINCGNADDEHPTQALIDLMTIKNELGRLDNLTIAIAGDLKYARATHSLVLALSRFKNITIKAASPEQLTLPDEYRKLYDQSDNTYIESQEMDLQGVDILYVAGFPPQLPNGEYAPQIRDKYKLTAARTKSLDNDAIILCPLPRIDEIDRDIDALLQACYFKQSENGLAMRMAVLQTLL